MGPWSLLNFCSLILKRTLFFPAFWTTPGLLLAGLKEPHGVPKIEPHSAAYKVPSLSYHLSYRLGPNNSKFFEGKCTVASPLP